MKSKKSFLAAILILSSGLAGAQQMYKWIGADGKVNYTDTPPPASARRAESRSSVGTTEDNASLPYELAQAASGNPVTLYTSSPCAPCDSARSFLKARGIPFTEKTVNTEADVQRMKQDGGDGSLPLVLVGRLKQIGFESNALGAMLTAAGYPATSKLPANYRYAAAAPVVAVDTPIAKASKAVPSADAANTPAASKPATAANSGFRF